MIPRDNQTVSVGSRGQQDRTGAVAASCVEVVGHDLCCVAFRLLFLAPSFVLGVFFLPTSAPRQIVLRVRVHASWRFVFIHAMESGHIWGCKPHLGPDVLVDGPVKLGATLENGQDIPVLEYTRDMPSLWDANPGVLSHTYREPLMFMR